jgi:glutamine amidotransferase-like uncharacterized protein
MIFFRFSAVKQNMPKIILYDDQGVDSESLKQLIKSFREIVDTSHYVLARMGAQTLIEDSWEEDTALLIISGGRDVFYHALLDGKGTDKIRSFIERGGKYLGICAGAYFACTRIEFEKGGALEVCGRRSLQLFPGVAKGPAYGINKYSYENLRGAEAAKISWKQSDCHVYFNGGCTFVAEEHLPWVKPISLYLDLEDQPPSILEIEVGKGLAFLSGVHFEYSARSFKKDDFYLSRLYPLLVQAEEKRKSLFREIVEKLGIPTFPQRKIMTKAFSFF